MEIKTDYRTSAQVAKVFRMTSKNVQRLTADGVIETVETPKGRRYDWDKTVEMYVAYLSDKAHGREKKQSDAELETEKKSAEARYKKAKADMAELELKELRGELHRASDVEAITTDHVMALRSMLMSMPGKVAVDMAAIKTAPEAAERMKKEVHFILDSLADYRYNPDEYKQRVRERQGWNERNGDDEDD